MIKNKIVICAAFLMLSLATRPMFAGTIIYSDAPAPTPDNVASVGYQANGIAEFGNLIQFASGTSRDLSAVTAVMSDWALASTYGSTDSGWSHPISLNLYTVNRSSGAPLVGTSIASVTQDFFIPWRPEPTLACGTGYMGSDGICHSGVAFEIVFDLTGVTVPDELFYGIAFDTNNWGYAPIGKNGPYESLNFGVTNSGPTVGSSPLPGTAYTNGNQPGTFSVFSYTHNGIVMFESAPDTVPEPGTAGLMLGGCLLALAGAIRRKKPAKR